MLQNINITNGMLYYLIKKIRPQLAQKIGETGKLETIVVGLGNQGVKHAGIMSKFGTKVTAGIDAKKSGVIHEVIPIYHNVEECLKEHPNIAAASIWKHYTSAKEAAIEVIESGIPLVVLITEGMPIKDVKDVIIKAEEYDTLLFGPNTPGIIFPPEGIKIGMLPDVFYPARSDGNITPEGVTIISRSGAILYHLSDALSSAGIAQNAVLGIGGDTVIGSDFKNLVPVIMDYDNTDLIIVAGEIGGCKEEVLAEDIKNNPEKYNKKPVLALISGANAPAGKTMGHAGAIISPGEDYGTFQSKKQALENAGVTVVNSQESLIKEAQKLLKNKKYFEVSDYYESMRKKWEEPPPKPSWGTYITDVKPNNISVRGYKLQDLIKNKDFITVATLLIEGELPNESKAETNKKTAVKAAVLDVPLIEQTEGEDISKILEKYILLDKELALFEGSNTERTMFCLGRILRYFGNIFGNDKNVDFNTALKNPFSHLIYKLFTGNKEINETHARILEAMITASVDHGVTPPSAQATILAATTRPSYEVAVAQGIGVITDVHGGAGAKATVFFNKCTQGKESSDYENMQVQIKEYLNSGRRIEGLGHRLHTEDPRRDVLYRLAEECNIAGRCVKLARQITKSFEQIKGISLPINVDGVIGAIVADMNLHPNVAKAIFIYGRAAGLSAHYFEEINTQPPMRRVNFTEAVYKGVKARKL